MKRIETAYIRGEDCWVGGVYDDNILIVQTDGGYDTEAEAYEAAEKLK